MAKNITREEISIVNKIKLKVAVTPTYLFKIKKINNPMCECGSLGTIDHLILNCPKYKHERVEIETNIRKITTLGPWSVIQLININENEWGKIIKRYLKKCKMKI